MKVVSRFEANLLRILHAFLRRAPLEPVWPLLRDSCSRPRCLSRGAVELVRDTLAKGCVQLLARHGGWRRERHLRGERVAEGRLWERTPPAELGLRFSRHALGFLIWITAARLDEARTRPWQVPEQELTPGDHLLLYFAYDVLASFKNRETAGGARTLKILQASSAFVGSPLCRLAHPEDFTGTAEDALPDFVPWTAGPGACILEALQPRLAEHCTEAEHGRRRMEKWQRRQAAGRSQERVLRAFLEAADRAGRWDLARFLLMAAAELLPEETSAKQWTGRLTDAGPRLADRAETNQATLALLHLLARLHAWTRRARGVGYLDEGYPASQLWKADWERWQGDVLCARAQAIIRQLDAMRQTRGTDHEPSLSHPCS